MAEITFDYGIVLWSHDQEVKNCPAFKNVISAMENVTFATNDVTFTYTKVNICHELNHESNWNIAYLYEQRLCGCL